MDGHCATGEEIVGCQTKTGWLNVKLDVQKGYMRTIRQVGIFYLCIINFYFLG